ncbi:CD44 antigen-like [Xyrauchen texanus]|uniref:CD44 antigen-like n=1 Tax=Xyrauchen texanus TaxID=154827 RepID=UPI002242BCF1|nr:CD44 antigen-like [Xyrauchen texanus]
MWTFLLVLVATGVPAPLQAALIQGHSGKCSFACVHHVKGTSQYSLTYQQALELCVNLGYKLATKEQVIEAFKNGLRTCRYGWTDGQNVTFLPHVKDPECVSSSTEVTFHAEEAEYLSDAYCFNPPDLKPHDIVLEEAKIEGFLVDEKKVIKRRKRETSPLNDDVIPTPDGSNTPQNVESTLQTSDSKDPELVSMDPIGNEDFSTTKSEEQPIDMEHPKTQGENSDTHSAVPDSANETMKPSTVPSLEEPNKGKDTEDTKGPTNKPHIGKRSIVPNILFPETEGSGSGTETGILSEAPEPTQYTTSPFTTEAAEEESFQNIEEVLKQNTNPEASGESKSRKNVPVSPTNPSAQEGEGTPAWLIIFAFCVVVGAILCLFAAIATKDMWYGPRQSKNAMSEEYSKAVTMRLSEKEQEIVTLMSFGNLKNDTKEDNTVTCVDKCETEYLM